MLSLVNQQKEIIACGREVKFTDISTQQGFIDLVHEQIWQLITDTDKKITPTDIELIGVAWPSLVQDNADQRLLFPSFLIPGFNEENGRYDATLFRPKGLSNARIEALHDGASAAVGIFQAQHENPVTDVWVLGLGTGLGEGVVSKGKVRKHLIDIWMDKFFYKIYRLTRNGHEYDLYLDDPEDNLSALASGCRFGGRRFARDFMLHLFRNIGENTSDIIQYFQGTATEDERAFLMKEETQQDLRDFIDRKIWLLPPALEACVLKITSRKALQKQPDRIAYAFLEEVAKDIAKVLAATIFHHYKQGNIQTPLKIVLNGSFGRFFGFDSTKQEDLFLQLINNHIKNCSAEVIRHYKKREEIQAFAKQKAGKERHSYVAHEFYQMMQFLKERYHEQYTVHEIPLLTIYRELLDPSNTFEAGLWTSLGFDVIPEELEFIQKIMALKREIINNQPIDEPIHAIIDSLKKDFRSSSLQFYEDKIYDSRGKGTFRKADKELLQNVAQQFEASSVKPVGWTADQLDIIYSISGRINDLIEIDGEKYVIKQVNETGEELNRLLQFLDRTAGDYTEARFTIPSLVKTHSGSLSFSFEGKTFILLPYLPSLDPASKNNNRDKIRQAATALPHIHQRIKKSFETPSASQKEVTIEKEILPEDLKPIWKETQEFLRTTQLPQWITHGDYSPNNLLFDEHGNLKVVLDPRTQIGSRILDIVFLAINSSDAYCNDDSILELITTEYQKEAELLGLPLSEEEIKAIPHYAMLRLFQYYQEAYKNQDNFEQALLALRIKKVSTAQNDITKRILLAA